MKSSSSSRWHQNLENYMSIKGDKFLVLGNPALLLFYSLVLTLASGVYFLYSPSGSGPIGQFTTKHHILQLPDQPNNKESCDLFRGEWVGDRRGPLYTNLSCPVIAYKTNCFMHGRKDTDFLHWRWKPEGCELPRFDYKNFLRIVRGKSMAFIGDSLGRNQMESLLCLLSPAETPEEVSREDTKDGYGSRTWKFKHHNFTVMILWSPFLVTATEITVNGSSSTGGFHLYLDKVDRHWSTKLPFIDFAIFSGAHWFFRPNYLYEEGNLIGCIYCQEPNITHFSPVFGVQRAFRTAVERVNKFNGIVAFLRTYSPAHFENGEWNSGGYCNRTRPVTKEESNDVGGSINGELKSCQVEEIERGRKVGDKKGNKFEVMDVTEMMQRRPDGHPGAHWGNNWTKGFNDCIHWCLPGPIDVWNQFLLEMLLRIKTTTSVNGRF